MADSSPNGSPVNNLKVEVRVGSKKEHSPRYRKETHGRGDDIDVNTPISEFRGASIFDRAKDELDALIDTIHPKKEYDHFVSPPKKELKEGGFRASFNRRLEKMSPSRSHNHQD
ncbi:hypothetical protein Tco_1436835 [Tanacetum coccineum]